ncbi:hypothetical protein C8Q77DRAFT_707968 [Trametes polyzona]|nr:hypothetical protein C8Q77DRAFT_707968 [Trametes polyzona]
MAPIDKLPTELLATIFSILRTIPRSPSWVRVLLVCRHWYEVACSSPGLWTPLVCNRRCTVQVLQVLLSRSAALSLQLSLDLHAAYVGVMLAALHPHTDRLQSLALRFSPAQLDDLGRHLTAVSHATTALDLHCLTDQAPLFPFNPEAFPLLRTLRATQVLPRPQRPMHGGITRLELTQIWHAPRTEDEQWQYDLLSSIASLPDLEYLVLQDALPPCIVAGGAGMRSVTLPSLRALQLSETIEDIRLFLHYVAVPPDARVAIIARTDGSMWEPDVAGVWLAILPENVSENLPMIPESRALRLFAGHNHKGPLALSGSALVETGDLDEPAWAIILPDCGEILSDAVFHALNDLPRVVPPPTLVHLELHIAPRIFIFDVNWTAVLSSLPHLRSLVIGSLWKAERVITSLYQNRDVLPELQSLELCLEEVSADPQRGPLPPPNADIPPRVLEKVVITQADDAPIPYIEGTMVGSMLRPLRYEFKHSWCAACHVSSVVFPVEGETSSADSGDSSETSLSGRMYPRVQ